MVTPGDVSKAYKAGKLGRQILDRRGWLRYLRYEAVVRAMSGGGSIVSERIAEAAEDFCELLDRTPLPRAGDGLTARLKQASQRFVTRGVTYPEYEGAAATTFYERLAAWVSRSAESERGREILRSIGFQSDGQDPAALFGISVANETQGILIEARRPAGQNFVRYKMAAEIHRAVPDAHLRRRHEHVRLWVRALVAGVASGVAAELVFVDDWLTALGLGVTVAAGTAIAEYAGPRQLLAADMLSARRQVAKWLSILARMLALDLITTAAADDIQLRGQDGLDRILHQIAAGEAYISPLDPDSQMLMDLRWLMENATLVKDTELRAHLMDLEAALRLDPADLPNALRRLEGLVQEGPDSAQRLTKPPALPRADRPAKALPLDLPPL